jgi:hypothetical protein
MEVIMTTDVLMFLAMLAVGIAFGAGAAWLMARWHH